jgi:molecular chaperone GrpE (heat shock protein)
LPLSWKITPISAAGNPSPAEGTKEAIMAKKSEHVEKNESQEGQSDEHELALRKNRLACKEAIRQSLRMIYGNTGDDPPNVNEAWDRLKRDLPNARRRRVRDVLNEDEFSRQRRAPGKRRLPTSLETATAKPAGGAQ